MRIGAMCPTTLAFVFCFVVSSGILVEFVLSLTGHVCSRQKEETYRVSTNKAFLCSERYTTSCGHLDWRRCTRYRVQTCYTPSERYAKRYREVEECCPGWMEASGSCSIPACYGLCQNGGVCSGKGAVPHCSCLPGFYGDSCQHAQNRPLVPPPPSTADDSSVPAWLLPVVVTTSVLGVAVLGVAGFCFFRKTFSFLGQIVSPTTGPPPNRIQTVSNTVSSVSTPSTMPSAPSYEEATAVHR